MYSRKILGGHFALRLGVAGHEKSHFHFAVLMSPPIRWALFFANSQELLYDSKTGTLRTFYLSF